MSESLVQSDSLEGGQFHSALPWCYDGNHSGRERKRILNS